MRFVLLLLLTEGTMADLMDSQLGPRIFSMLRINLLFTGVSLAYWYGKRSIMVERARQRLEKQIADARLRGLKNQINPHFLYNTLSFLYTKALPLSKELSDAISKLSEMMRYSLGELDEDEKVPLEKEIRHLENFIQIHQLRYYNNLKIDFSIKGETGGYKIMPLLLITFVENAFKHGKVQDDDHPLTVHIEVAKGVLDFKVMNKKANGTKEKSSGIGLANVKSRLELGYPEAHKLMVEDSSQLYCVHLILNLEK